MKQVISFTLIFALIIQLFWSSGMLVDYYVNTDIYKENCENKSRPELNCDGKCILAQKLLKSQKEEESTFWSPISFEYLATIEKIKLTNSFYVLDHQFRWMTNYQITFDQDIFKPPV